MRRHLQHDVGRGAHLQILDDRELEVCSLVGADPAAEGRLDSRLADLLELRVVERAMKVELCL